MNYLIDFIAAYGQTQGLIEYLKYREHFSIGRTKYTNPLLQHFFKPQANNPGDLRESTVIPFVCDYELKPGYYFANLIH